jgi:hypothetical protein
MFPTHLFGNKLVCEMIDFYVWKNYISLVNIEYHSLYFYRETSHRMFRGLSKNTGMLYNHRSHRRQNSLFVASDTHDGEIRLPTYYYSSKGDSHHEYHMCYHCRKVYTNIIRICHDNNCHCDKDFCSGFICGNCKKYICRDYRCSGECA